ncbi:MAG: hypothetical protein ACRDT9_00175 [Agromyces sp.]
MSEYRLRDAVEAVDTLVGVVSNLIDVAIGDVRDVNGIDPAELDLIDDPRHQRRFARALVERLQFEDVIFEPAPSADPNPAVEGCDR